MSEIRDAYIVSACRSAIGVILGGLSSFTAPQLGALAIRETVKWAGVDPNEMRFKRAGCFDVGVKCGGWGRIVLQCRVVDRDEVTSAQEAK